MLKKFLIYRTSKITSPEKENNLSFQEWHPSWISLQPGGKSLKYLFYFLFQKLNFFRNPNYSYFRSFIDEIEVCNFLVVPAYYRWPFMASNDVQFTYVRTKKEHRGNGIAWQSIYQAHKKLCDKGVANFWYITDEQNMASQKLAAKMGFTLVGYGLSKTRFFGLIKVLEVDETL